MQTKCETVTHKKVVYNEPFLQICTGNGTCTDAATNSERKTVATDAKHD